jgi:hypothetical protein
VGVIAEHITGARHHHCATTTLASAPRLLPASHVARFIFVVVATNGDTFSPFLPPSLLKPSHMYIQSESPDSGLLNRALSRQFEPLKIDLFMVYY